MARAKFTVDTHLFRELGELLVGRDSTALIELIKNAYDADATEVLVQGRDLNSLETGLITIIDNGVGMTEEQFELGFLRIASRLKDTKDRRSAQFHRRFTGAKGIGRLAAHKLARFIEIYSVPGIQNGVVASQLLHASIDWEKVEAKATLDDLADSDAITIRVEEASRKSKRGTTIHLKRLRRKWTEAERARFFAEVQTYRPPLVLTSPPKSILEHPLLFEAPIVADARSTDPGFDIELTGEFAAGEEYWQNLSQTAQWLIEIDAFSKGGKIRVQVAPTRKGLTEFPDAALRSYKFVHPNLPGGPFFHARILIREGGGGNRGERAWLGRTSGIRVFMEGFRVLPYGEPNDDWLSIDADYKKRQKALTYLNEVGIKEEVQDEEEGLLFLGNSAYFGAIFLTSSSAPGLQMLVNREGFIPDSDYESLVQIVRTAVYLSVRVRAAAKAERRDERSQNRKTNAENRADPSRRDLGAAVRHSVERASKLASEARELASAGKFKAAEERISDAAREFERGALTSERLMTEGAVLRVLASVGTQMAAFVHEIRGLLEIATTVERTLHKIRDEGDWPPPIRKKLADLHVGLTTLRRAVERHASYLTDVTSADATRRRSRQSLAERFDSAMRFVDRVVEQKGIKIVNDIPLELKSPPMFRAELTLIFSNLLSNAVRAAGEDGKILIAAQEGKGRTIILRMQNTGRSVRLQEAERWFRPFESTTTTTDPVLGQGMGMGLPITRNMLEDYGATIEFVAPQHGYKTALEITFPGE